MSPAPTLGLGEQYLVRRLSGSGRDIRQEGEAHEERHRIMGGMMMGCCNVAATGTPSHAVGLATHSRGRGCQVCIRAGSEHKSHRELEVVQLSQVVSCN